MKKLTAAIAATLFAAGVSASDNIDFYHGLSRGNPDLSPPPPQPISGGVTAVQPGVGSSFDFHHGLSRGNPDLSPPPATSVSYSGKDPDIYKGFSSEEDSY